MTVGALTRVFAGLRLAYSLALMAAPGRVAEPWLGSVAGTEGGAVAVRGLAARDVVISLAVLTSARVDRARRASLLACAASDAADVGATLMAGRDALPARARLGTIVLAGGSAATAVALAGR